jgi:hypothetical protein
VGQQKQGMSIMLAWTQVLAGLQTLCDHCRSCNCKTHAHPCLSELHQPLVWAKPAEPS